MAVGLSACLKAPEELFQLDFDRVFTPTTLEAVPTQAPSARTPEEWNISPTVMELTTTFEWAVSPNVTQYNLQISTDPNFETITHDLVVSGTVFEIPSPLVPNRLPWSTNYFIRVMAIAPDDLRADDSRWNTYAFSTPAEQLFHLPGRADIGSSFVRLRWHPGSAANNIVVRQGGANGPIVDSREIVQTDSTFFIEGLNPETELTVQIRQGTTVRGQLPITTRRGVNCLADTVVCLPHPVHGWDLGAILEDPDNIGRIIYLPPDTVFEIDATIEIPGSIHIFGSYDGARPIIRLITTGGSPLISLPMLPFPGQATEFIIFENVELTSTGANGWIFDENQATQTRLRYLRFESVLMHNFRNNAINLRNAHFYNIIVNDTEVHTMGFGSNMGFVHLRLEATVDNILITNSTFSNMIHGFFDFRHRTNAHRVQITIENTTFDQIVGHEGADRRYFVDMVAQANQEGGGRADVVIRNVIFGSTFNPDVASGIRASAASTTMVENSFRTTDWITTNPVGENFDIPQLETFSGGRTGENGLFVNPNARDFRFNPGVSGFILNAGDPRWRP